MAYQVGASFSLPLSFVMLMFSALLSTLGGFGLYGTLVASSGHPPGRVASAGAAITAASSISWLALGALAAASVVWGWASAPVHVATVAAFCCWFVGLLLLGVTAFGARLPGRLRILPLTVVALVPLSVLLPMFTTVGMPLVINSPFLGMSILGLVLLRYQGVAAETPTVVTAAPTAGSGPAVRRRIWFFRKARPTAGDASTMAGERERELLEALQRHGKLTVAGAALETSLTVDEADRMLSTLAVKGHLEVHVERGRLLYSL